MKFFFKNSVRLVKKKKLWGKSYSLKVRPRREGEAFYQRNLKNGSRVTRVWNRLRMTREGKLRRFDKGTR